MSKEVWALAWPGEDIAFGDGCCCGGGGDFGTAVGLDVGCAVGGAGFVGVTGRNSGGSGGSGRDAGGSGAGTGTMLLAAGSEMIVSRILREPRAVFVTLPVDRLGILSGMFATASA